jgi:hypothetical protein
MALLPKKSLDLSNSSPVLRALMYVASLQTFGSSSSSSSSLRWGWSGTDERKQKRLKELKRLIRMNLKNTDLIYRLLLSAIWVVLCFVCVPTACCTSYANTAIHPPTPLSWQSCTSTTHPFHPSTLYYICLSLVLSSIVTNRLLLIKIIN